MSAEKLEKQESSAATPAAVQAADVTNTLEEDIALGRLHPRERLVEEDLMQRFKAKKHVVRAALGELERMGLIVRIANRGARVKDITPTDVDHIYLLRKLLERAAVSQISLPPPPTFVDKLENIQLRHDAAVAAQNLRGVFRINNLFHRTFFEGCGNVYLTEAIVDAQQKANTVRSYAISDAKLLQQVRKDHWSIISALKNNARDRLAEVCVNHLRPSKEAYKQNYFKRFSLG